MPQDIVGNYKYLSDIFRVCIVHRSTDIMLTTVPDTLGDGKGVSCVKRHLEYYAAGTYEKREKLSNYFSNQTFLSS